MLFEGSPSEQDIETVLFNSSEHDYSKLLIPDEYDDLEISIYRSHVKIGDMLYYIQWFEPEQTYHYPHDLLGSALPGKSAMLIQDMNDSTYDVVYDTDGPLPQVTSIQQNFADHEPRGPSYLETVILGLGMWMELPQLTPNGDIDLHFITEDNRYVVCADIKCPLPVACVSYYNVLAIMLSDGTIGFCPRFAQLKSGEFVNCEFYDLKLPASIDGLCTCYVERTEMLYVLAGGVFYEYELHEDKEPSLVRSVNGMIGTTDLVPSVLDGKRLKSGLSGE